MKNNNFNLRCPFVRSPYSTTHEATAKLIHCRLLYLFISIVFYAWSWDWVEPSSEFTQSEAQKFHYSCTVFFYVCLVAGFCPHSFSVRNAYFKKHVYTSNALDRTYRRYIPSLGERESEHRISSMYRYCEWENPCKERAHTHKHYRHRKQTKKNMWRRWLCEWYENTYTRWMAKANASKTKHNRRNSKPFFLLNGFFSSSTVLHTFLALNHA